MDALPYVAARTAELETELKKQDQYIAVLERQKRSVEAQLADASTTQAQLAGALMFAREVLKKGEDKDVPPPA